MLNSDNINITGESFDYGPWRFTPEWDPDFTAAYFDHSGLYAFGRQPEAIHWDLAQLAGCLSLIADGAALSDMLGELERAVRRGARRRAAPPARRRAATRDDRRGADRRRSPPRAAAIDRVFFDWRGGRDPGAEAYPHEPFRELAQALDGRSAAATHPYWSDAAPCSMHIDEVEAIWAAIAERDDWQPFEDKVRAVRRMGEAMEQDARQAKELRKRRASAAG